MERVGLKQPGPPVEEACCGPCVLVWTKQHTFSQGAQHRGTKGNVSTVCSTPATCPWGSGVQVPWRSLGALHTPITLPLLKHRWAFVKSETGSSLGISKGR